jgi:uncharacterized lipoprotein YmbA
MNKINKTLFTLLGTILIVGCSKPLPPEIIYETHTVQQGQAQYVWEEPTVDVIDVPPGLDPDGVYYRPAHKQVVEIRQGRWKYYKGSEEDK